jgi:hypothetical protein
VPAYKIRIPTIAGTDELPPKAARLHQG